jgi:transcriptional regulator with XRE-family HTH domain
MNVFKAARKAAGLTQEELAERAGMSRITVNRIEQKGTCSRKQAEVFAPLLGVAVETLMLGDAYRDAFEHSAAAVQSLQVAGEVAAGIWLEPDILDEPRFEPVAAVIDPRFPRESQFALIVRGPSINRTAGDGATLLCVSIDVGVEVRDGDLVIVERTRDQGAMIETTAKFVRRIADGYELWPHSTDPRYQKPLFIADDASDEDEHVRIRAKVLSINSAPQSPWVR